MYKLNKEFSLESRFKYFNTNFIINQFEGDKLFLPKLEVGEDVLHSLKLIKYFCFPFSVSCA